MQLRSSLIAFAYVATVLGSIVWVFSWRWCLSSPFWRSRWPILRSMNGLKQLTSRISLSLARNSLLVLPWTPLSCTVALWLVLPVLALAPCTPATQFALMLPVPIVSPPVLMSYSVTTVIAAARATLSVIVERGWTVITVTLPVQTLFQFLRPNLWKSVWVPLYRYSIANISTFSPGLTLNAELESNFCFTLFLVFLSNSCCYFLCTCKWWIGWYLQVA